MSTYAKDLIGLAMILASAAAFGALAGSWLAAGYVHGCNGMLPLSAAVCRSLGF